MILALFCIFKGSCSCEKKVQVESRQMARVNSLDLQDDHTHDSVEITVKT